MVGIYTRMTEFQSVFRARDVTTDAMKRAISTWHELYYAKEATEKEDPCQQIPHTIVRKLTKTVFSEYAATSKDAFVQGVLDAINSIRDSAMQKALIGGECLLKPVPDGDKFRFSVVARSDVAVFGRDVFGRMTDVGTAEYTADDRYYYTLLERRMVDPAGYLTIRNYLYRSTNEGVLGQYVPLKALPQYERMADVYTFQRPVGSIGLIPLRTPVENCVDGSRDAVSVYAAAVGLIHNINVNQAQINGEFERGESRIVVSSDMLQRDPETKKRIFKDHVFTGLNEDADTTGITIFSPQLRIESFEIREQSYLRSVESIIGLKRGLLSEVEAADRTAKEITSSEGDYNLTIIDFQNAWEAMIHEAVRVCGVLGQLYRVTGAHEVTPDAVAIDWGNGILYDEESAWADMKDQVARGLLKPEIAVGWRYGMPYDTEAQRQKIRERYMPDVLDESGEE